MARAIVRLVPMEMAILGAFEFTLLFALIFMMLTFGGPALLLETGHLSRDCMILAGMLALTIGGIAATIGLYRPDVCLDRKRLLMSGTIAALFAFPAILIVSGAFNVALKAEHVAWLAELLAIWLPFVLLVRLCFSAIAPYMPVTRRVLIIGSGTRAADLRRRLEAKQHALFAPIAPIALDFASGVAGGQMGQPCAIPVMFGDAPRAVSPLAAWSLARRSGRGRVWGVVIAEDEPAQVNKLALLDGGLRGVPVYSDQAFHERHLGRIQLDGLDAATPDFDGAARPNIVSAAAKRVLDIVTGVALLVVTLPMMLVTVLAIKIDSPGPVFYPQVRTGLRGEDFTLLKFRSMSMDAEISGQPQWARERDPRVTRVGAFIRATRIDELPQLMNVIRGEMSMIGPRPERPVFVEQLAKVIPFYHHRCDVKPGLTGWAQVNFPYGASVEDAREKLAYDLYYVKNRGLLLDLIILLATVRVILFREGAR